jgi:hypothetical protein
VISEVKIRGSEEDFSSCKEGIVRERVHNPCSEIKEGKS